MQGGRFVRVEEREGLDASSYAASYRELVS
jgi:hypothetical protein